MTVCIHMIPLSQPCDSCGPLRERSNTFGHIPDEIQTLRSVVRAREAEVARLKHETYCCDCHAEALKRAERIETVALTIAEGCESACDHHEGRDRGGQTVGYRGPFACSMTPSGIKTLREWAGLIRAAIEGSKG